MITLAGQIVQDHVDGWQARLVSSGMDVSALERHAVGDARGQGEGTDLEPSGWFAEV